MLNIANIPPDQRPSDKTWECIKELADKQEVTLSYEDDMYLVKFHDDGETIPLLELEYSSEIGMYDKRRFPSLGK